MLLSEAAEVVSFNMSVADGSRSKAKAKCAFGSKRKLVTLRGLNRSGLCRNTSRKFS